jgi:SAM-dependent MidA family methyltransferase
LNNELLDAFPILKFIYKDGKWCEILVDNDSDMSTEDNINFKYTTSKPNNENVVNYLQPENTFQGLKISEGETYELSPERNLKLKQK